MTDFSDKLRLKEMAEEDIYFVKRDQELIRALHEQKLAELLNDHAKKKEEQAMELQEKYAKVTKKHGSDPRKLAAHYRKLIENALKLIKG
jgi:hypothetical protein